MNLLNELTQMSNRYGANAEYVLAGGGNTSVKDGDILYIKGSGTSLATILPEEFVKLSRERLNVMMTAKYPDSDKEREAAALLDMMNARLPGETRRPSVESPLHNLFPHTFVLHVHPALVNGLTCGQDGQSLTGELFPDAVWVPACKPGYVLAKDCNDALLAYKEKMGRDANVLVLENHGIFVAGNTVAEIDAVMEDVFAKLRARVSEPPDVSPVAPGADERELAAGVAPCIRMLYGEGTPVTVTFVKNALTDTYLLDADSFAPLLNPFSPDHIVYCKANPLYINMPEDKSKLCELTAERFVSYKKKHGYAPKIVAVQSLGFFACGKNKKEADIAAALFNDALKVCSYSIFFGGAKTMPQHLVDFIVNWETESYRQGVALSGGANKRLDGRVTVITGSAQGFGKGIAEYLAGEGGYIVIADMNYEGAKSAARELSETYKSVFLPVAVNVADEESVKAMVEETVLNFGGIDLFVSNAGIVKAGGLEELDKRSFELVTAVNYTGYFLCTKYASRVMKLQHRFAPDYYMDIVEVNSKSGLAGSNKNFAYAGSKFGGVGLTQSFALELTEYNIKVNAVCPGNYLDGPLWSDPEKGLFVQYLKAGKVPGAKTIADVKRSYEDKVPMRRGCVPADVAKAILYCTEQTYETGQTLPVTGGQIMK